MIITGVNCQEVCSMKSLTIEVFISHTTDLLLGCRRYFLLFDSITLRLVTHHNQVKSDVYSEYVFVARILFMRSENFYRFDVQG